MTGRLQDAEDKEFRVSKKRVLAELEACIDRSKKGAVDEQVGDVIGLLNDHPGFVTTSSCSGRCAIFLEGSEKKKQSGQFFLKFFFWGGGEAEKGREWKGSEVNEAKRG